MGSEGVSGRKSQPLLIRLPCLSYLNLVLNYQMIYVCFSFLCRKVICPVSLMMSTVNQPLTIKLPHSMTCSESVIHLGQNGQNATNFAYKYVNENANRRQCVAHQD